MPPARARAPALGRRGAPAWRAGLGAGAAWARRAWRGRLGAAASAARLLRRAFLALPSWRLSWRLLGGFLGRFLRRLLGGLLRRLLRRFLRGFLLRRQNLFLALFLFLPFLFFLPLAIVILLLPPINVYRAFQVVRLQRGAQSISSILAAGPPVAQSRSSIVCTTGTDVPPAICTMHPILPAAIMSGLTIAILATFRSRNLPAMSGWRML